MTLRASDPPRPATERRAGGTLPVSGELGATVRREDRLKGGIHPSLRALPDYPAR